MSYTIIFATRNKGKQNEIIKVAARFGLASKIRFPENEYPESAEEHSTFEENARQKAQDAAEFFSGEELLLFVGDDSGMEIASLGGAPGVKTRRWGGKRLSDEEFDAYCLNQLAGKTGAARDAVLKTTICLLDAASERYFYGVFNGNILETPRRVDGNQDGFPLASLFYVPDAGDVLGNIQNSTNHSVKTHRELALEELFKHIQSYY